MCFSRGKKEVGRIYRSIAGTVRMRITTADTAALLTAISEKSIQLFDVKSLSELTVEVVIYRVDCASVLRLAQKRGDQVQIKNKLGLYWSVRRLLERPVLLVMLVFLAIAVSYLPGRVFFVRVEGNSAIPERLILARAQECGISFGASRRAVRSEKMKNSLLEAIPQLQWAGINTSGCVATISVMERTQSAEQEKINGVASIVAVRDGVITECTVTKGTALCKVGQAVKVGEVLVSGYTDCGFKIQATAAEAEVFGVTNRDLQVVMPSNYMQKGTVSRTTKKYSLLFGKNKINFFKDSGISPAECDKMYTEYYLTLPGGFQLPVALIVEEIIYYENSVQNTLDVSVESMLSEYAEGYLAGQMVSGTILNRSEAVELLQDIYVLNAQYTCRELIGRVQSEEIIQHYGEND